MKTNKKVNGIFVTVMGAIFAIAVVLLVAYFPEFRSNPFAAHTPKSQPSPSPVSAGLTNGATSSKPDHRPRTGIKSGRSWKGDEDHRITALFGGTDTGCALPVLRLSDPDLLATQQRLMSKHIPFLVKGHALEWPAITKWTKQQLLSRYGNRQVKQDSETSIVHNSGGVSQGTTLRDFIDGLENIAEGHHSDHFVFDTNILQSIPELQKDVIVPPFVAHWDNPVHEDSQQMWHMISIGPSMSGLPMHSHGETWIATLFGGKKWFLYPPGFDVPADMGRTCNALCTVSRWVSDFYPRLQLLPDLMEWVGASSTSSSSSLSTIAELETRFEQVYALHDLNGQHFRPLECFQEAGDLMYLPDSWLHLTFNVGETVGYGGQASLPAQKR
jgi:hypothetical protein